MKAICHQAAASLLHDALPVRCRRFGTVCECQATCLRAVTVVIRRLLSVPPQL